MSFGAMAAWQALLLLAVAGAAAWWLFRLKVRPPRISVPSLVLWRRVLDHARDLTWWERFRRVVSMVATVVVALALALAVTRPGPRLTAASRGRTLIVLDSSWSMLAETSSGETRWQRAVAEAKALAQSAAGDEVAVATTAEGLVEGPTTDTALIETALDRLAPIGGEGTAWPKVGGAEAAHFFTDGAVARPIGADVTVHPVFDAAPNVAVTALSVRPPTPGDARPQAYLEIANYATTPQEVKLTLIRGTTTVFDQPVQMAAGETIRQIVPLQPNGDGRLRARVTARANALPVDDEAFAWIAGAEPLTVAVVSDDPGALALLLQRDPSVRAMFSTPATYRPGVESTVIFDRWLPADAPAKPALVLAPPAASWLGAPGIDERAPRWTSPSVHPVLGGVDPLTIDIKRARTYAAPSLVTIAASENGTPLVSVHDEPTRRLVVLGFAVADSNLAFAPAFPVLIGNAIDWLARPAITATGHPGPLALPASTTRVVAPDGTSVPLVRTGDRAVAVLRTPGLYDVEGGGAHSVVVANVGGQDVSNLSRTTLKSAGLSASAERVSGRPWWLYALVLAFVLAGIEWWTWQRRVTV